MKYRDILKWVQDLQEGLGEEAFNKLLDTPILLSNNVTIEEFTSITNRLLPAGVQPVINVAVKSRNF